MYLDENQNYIKAYSMQTTVHPAKTRRQRINITIFGKLRLHKPTLASSTRTILILQRRTFAMLYTLRSF